MSLAVAIVSLAGPQTATRLHDWLRSEAGDDVPISVLGPDGGPVPRRRADAVRGCTTEGLLLVEDTVRPAGGWLAAARAALRDQDLAAASGPLRLAPELSPRGQAWARHEYADAIGAGTGARDRLPGHLLLLRVDLAVAALQGDDGLREDAFFAALRGLGGTCALVHGLAGEIVAADPGGATLRGQFLHGRGWARRERVRAGWGAPERAARLLAWPAIAALRARGAVVGGVSPRVAAHALAFSAAWAVGEGVGATFGGPASEEFWA